MPSQTARLSPNETNCSLSKNNPPNGEQLAMLIRQQLAGRAYVHNLHVIVLKEGVVLRGRSSTYYAKQLAQHTVLTIARLPLIANEIEVQK
jgi:hypothetical protein